ncbi:phage minor capsid protein [Metabacillus sp. HB246100]
MEPLRQQQIAMSTVDVYLEIEHQLLINMAKRLRQHRSLLADFESWQGDQITIISWQTAQLSMLEHLTQDNIKTIAKYSGLAIDEVSQALEIAGYEAIDEFEGDLQEAVQKGLLVKPPVVGESQALENILSSYQSQAISTLNLINTTILDQSRQVYRDIVNNTVGVVMSGTMNPLDALRSISSKWAEKGIPALIRKDGARMSTEAYLNSVMRSTVNNVANDMQDTRMDEFGVDLVEISSHMGARPKCAKYQGRIFSRSGNHPKYEPLSSTSIGEADGLFGVNCRHIKYPYIEGITRRTYKPQNAKENREVYLKTQRQRELERGIRNAKKRLEVMQAMGDEVGERRAKELVRSRQARMREFINETGLIRNRVREQIV